VILVGEMRDLEPFPPRCSPAETGHLVLSTLHTLDATETIQRIIAVFPPPEQKQIRLQLAATLKAVVSQRLVRRADDKGRVPACEIMIATGYIRDCIINADKTRLIHDAIAAAPASTACRRSINRSSTSTRSSSSPSTKPSLAPPTPTNSSCAFKGIRSAADAAREEMASQMADFERVARNSHFFFREKTTLEGSMQKRIIRSLIILLALVCTAFGSRLLANTSLRPLRKSELLALVAAGVLPENTAYEIRSKGLSFVPDESYRALLKSAGADAKVFAALDSAKTSSSEKSDSAAEIELLRHLSRAGSLTISSQFDAAANELTEALAGNSVKPEIGFVMGNVLIEQERMRKPGKSIRDFASDPDFPQVTPD